MEQLVLGIFQEQLAKVRKYIIIHCVFFSCIYTIDKFDMYERFSHKTNKRHSLTISIASSILGYCWF